MLNRSPEDSMQDIDKRSLIWWMFMSSTLEASVVMGMSYSDNLHSIKNTGKDLTLKQMYEISKKLIVEQSDEIFEVSQIRWASSPWKQLSLVNDDEVISLSHAKVSVFSDSVLCLRRTRYQILFGNDSWNGSKIHHNTEHWTQSTENRWNSSGIFPGIHYIGALSAKSKSSWAKWANPNNSKDELSSCRCSMTSYGEIKTINRNVLLIPHLWLYLQKKSTAGRWSFLGPGSDTKWHSIDKERPGGEWDRVAELMMIKFGESGHLVFRATSPLSRGTLKSKGGGKLSIHFCADGDTIETVFSNNYFC